LPQTLEYRSGRRSICADLFAARIAPAEINAGDYVSGLVFQGLAFQGLRKAGAKFARLTLTNGATPMHSIIYIVGLVVIVLAVLSFFGLR